MQQRIQQTSLLNVRGGQLQRAIPELQKAGAEIDKVETDHRGRHHVTVIGGDPDAMRNAPGVRNVTR